MVQRLVLSVAFLIWLQAAAFAQSGPPVDPIVAKQAQLGVALLQKSAAGKNRSISPFSVHSGLMLARLGAKGETAKQLDSLLFSSPFSPELVDTYGKLQASIVSESENTQVRIANSIWISDQGAFATEYQKTATDTLKAEARSLDFLQSEKARTTINSWVAEKTKKLIPNLIPKGLLTKDTRATLVNALYFKAPWAEQFKTSATTNEKFWINSKDSVNVPMMHITDTLGYYEDKEFQAVMIAYGPPLYHFILFVPREHRSTGEVAKLLSADLLAKIWANPSSSSVKLSLPRFKISESANMADSLKALGCTQPFSDNADFSDMTTLPIKISAVQHEAVVAVDEKGTEAAAATAVIMAKLAGFVDQAPPKEVTADRPFAFAIIHSQTQAPLFLGIVGDPR